MGGGSEKNAWNSTLSICTWKFKIIVIYFTAIKPNWKCCIHCNKGSLILGRRWHNMSKVWHYYGSIINGYTWFWPSAACNKVNMSTRAFSKCKKEFSQCRVVIWTANIWMHWTAVIYNITISFILLKQWSVHKCYWQQVSRSTQ